MKNLKFGLSDSDISSFKLVFSKYSTFQEIILYGSRAKGNFKRGSDIDLVLIAPAMDLSQLLAIENQIDDLMLPYKVDLSLFHKIEKPQLLEPIERIGLEF